MDTYRDMILKMFKSGLCINSITEMIYNQLKEERKQNKDMPKANKRDAKNIVEKAIYKSMKQQN